MDEMQTLLVMDTEDHCQYFITTDEFMARAHRLVVIHEKTSYPDPIVDKLPRDVN